MATFISLHIKSDSREHITKLLQELSDVNQMTYGAYPKELDENILLGRNANPNFIAVGNVQNGWISVQLNSFKKLHEWAEKISKELQTSVIQIICKQSLYPIRVLLQFELDVPLFILLLNFSLNQHTLSG